MVAHGFAQHFAVGFVIMKSEGVGALRAFEFNGRDVGKIAHSILSETGLQSRIERTELLQPLEIF